MAYLPYYSTLKEKMMVYIILAIFAIFGAAMLIFPKELIQFNVNLQNQRFKNARQLQPRTWYVTYYRLFGLVFMLIALYGIGRALFHF